MSPRFVFATCRAGSESALKKEVAAAHGGLLTPAFMRPQLITWKAREDLPPTFELGAAFAAVCGRSVGMARTPEDVRAFLLPREGEPAGREPQPGTDAGKAGIESAKVDLSADASATTHPGLQVEAVHVFPRDIPEDGVPEETWARVDEVRTALAPFVPLTPGSGQVLDVILGAPGEPWFLGTHRQGPEAHPHPGAVPRLIIPPEAPSRAWLKMEQALAWLGLDAPGLLHGRTALELGSAPGGASWALLRRGLRVWGVDTGAMDARVLADPAFTHLVTTAGALTPAMVPPRMDLVASDMNLPPEVVLGYIEPMCRRLRPRWLLLTLKMNDARVEAQLPRLLDRIRQFAPAPLRVRQLHANRREVTVAAGR